MFPLNTSSGHHVATIGGNTYVRYDEIMPDCAVQRFAILARDLSRAVRWFERDVASGDASWPVVRSQALAVRFVSRIDADRFAAAAIGIARWRSANGRAIYLADRTRGETDREALAAFVQTRLDRLGSAGAGEIVDGLIIDCSFASDRAATEFAHALNAADLPLQDERGASDGRARSFVAAQPI